jgi:hypothetical protein
VIHPSVILDVFAGEGVEGHENGSSGVHTHVKTSRFEMRDRRGTSPFGLVPRPCFSVEDRTPPVASATLDTARQREPRPRDRRDADAEPRDNPPRALDSDDPRHAWRTPCRRGSSHHPRTDDPAERDVRARGSVPESHAFSCKHSQNTG